VTPPIAAASGCEAVVTRLTGGGAAGGGIAGGGSGGVAGGGGGAPDGRPDTQRLLPRTHAVVALLAHRLPTLGAGRPCQTAALLHLSLPGGQQGGQSLPRRGLETSELGRHPALLAADLCRLSGATDVLHLLL